MEKQHEERICELGAYACENCFRRCICIRERDSTNEPRCLCGARLESTELPPGVYEIVDMSAPTDSAKAPRVEDASSNLTQEADVGYGKSHGYDPSHGGPTGPGDAPAGNDERG